MIKCNKCGFDISNEDAKFCPHCGEKVIKKITCPKCHRTDIPIEAKFCPECGHSFEQPRVDPYNRFDNKPIEMCGESTIVDGYEAADLGLGVLWSIYNVGASSIISNGLNFSWGDPERKTITSKFSNWFRGAPSQADICGSEHDMARTQWGGHWQLPTCQQCLDLIDRCSWKAVRYHGENYYKVTSYSNGNYILMPVNLKLWIGDRAFGGTVHFLNTQRPQIESEQFDVDHTYYVRPLIVK